MKDAVSQGYRRTLWAATSQEAAELNVCGEHIVPDKKATGPSSMAKDEELAEWLWKLSEMSREKLGELLYKGVGTGEECSGVSAKGG